MSNFYGEHDTDKIVRETYFPDYSYKGIIVEVGAATPEYLSTTKHFKENGWRAIHIEPNPKFAKQHMEAGNEIYEYACCDKDEDNVDFTVVKINENNNNNINKVTDHSFSSFNVKESYKNIDTKFFDGLSKEIIKVKSRRLDTIFNEINIESIDILSIDTEGWELEVMKGLSKVKPTIIILENVLHEPSYNEYMKSVGYTLDQIIIHNYIYTKNE
jgi:FkbM family methyltransferase